jgi:hypothetical protein
VGKEGTKMKVWEERVKIKYSRNKQAQGISTRREKGREV